MLPPYNFEIAEFKPYLISQDYKFWVGVLHMHSASTNNTGLPADMPDYKSALLNTDIGRCR